MPTIKAGRGRKVARRRTIPSKRWLTVRSLSFGICLSSTVMYLVYAFAQSLRWKTRSSPKATYQPSAETLSLVDHNPEAFWDCHLAATPCVFFRPHAFFSERNLSSESYKRLGGLNNNLPAMTALSWTALSSSHNTHQENHELSYYLPHNISFIHVHKAGGTTVKKLLARARASLTEAQEGRQNSFVPVTAQLETFKYSLGGGSTQQKAFNQQRRQAHIEAMVQAQQHRSMNANEDSIVFALVRDPIERFVSAVQQVMHYHEEFRSQCLQWTARATLQCAIQYTRDTDFVRDVHLLPMATHVRLWDDFPAFRMAVLHLRDIQVLARYFTNVGHTTGSGDNDDNKDITSMIPHGRDRSHVEYATSPVLAHMSVADCTADMVEELCQLYAIDVALMHTLGFDSPYCT